MTGFAFSEQSLSGRPATTRVQVLTLGRGREKILARVSSAITLAQIFAGGFDRLSVFMIGDSPLIGKSLSMTPCNPTSFRAILYLEQYYGNGNRGETIAPIFVAEKMCNEVQKQVFFASLALLYLVDGKFGNVSKLAFSL